MKEDKKQKSFNLEIMKNIIAILAVLGILSLESCTINEVGPTLDNDTIPEAFEVKDVDLFRVTNNEYNFSSTFNYEIGGDLYNDETVLVYRLTAYINSSTPIWQLIPRTIYFSSGDVLDYYYDFSKVDFVITARGSYNLLTSPSYIDNQTFRVVILPSNLASITNINNYLEVMNALNLKESQVQNLNF